MHRLSGSRRPVCPVHDALLIHVDPKRVLRLANSQKVDGLPIEHLVRPPICTPHQHDALAVRRHERHRGLARALAAEQGRKLEQARVVNRSPLEELGRAALAEAHTAGRPGGAGRHPLLFRRRSALWRWQGARRRILGRRRHVALGHEQRGVALHIQALVDALPSKIEERGRFGPCGRVVAHCGRCALQRLL